MCNESLFNMRLIGQSLFDGLRAAKQLAKLLTRSCITPSSLQHYSKRITNTNQTCYFKHFEDYVTYKKKKTVMALTVGTLSQWVSTYLLGISLSVCIKKPSSTPNCIASLPKTSKSLKSVLYHLATSVIKPSVGMSALKACQEHLFTNGPIITPDMYTLKKNCTKNM